MPVEFKCPSCAGDLSVTESEKSVRCPYCGSTVLVPEQLLEQPGEVRTTVFVDTARTAKSVSGCVIVAASLGTVAVAGLVMIFMTAIGKVPDGSPRSTSPDVLLRFGSQGTGHGFFSDPRHIAVDGSGRIFVADYTTGRIQAFDGEGGFIDQWNVESGSGDVYISGMDASAEGILYVVEGGRLLAYDGGTGEPAVSPSSLTGFEDVFVAEDGEILATMWSADDHVYRFDPDGGVELHLTGPVRGVTGSPELSPLVAADGLGNILVLGVFSSSVFQFDSDGNYRNMFGSRGTEPGQLSAPSDIVVDGRGRVYVSDMGGIVVFDSSGRFLGLLDPGSQGYVHGMDIGPDGNLFVVTGAFEVVSIEPFAD